MATSTTNKHERRMVNLANSEMDGTGWLTLVKSKVTPEMLASQECAEVYRYALKCNARDGRFPSAMAIRQVYPNFPWKTVNESFSWVIAEFKKWRKDQVIHDMVADLVDTYSAAGHEPTLELAIERLKEIQAEDVVETGDVETDDEDYFWGLMDRRRDTSGDIIPTGFPSIDDSLNGGGLRPGHLMIIIARDKVGKSTLSMQMAINMMEDGCRVVYQTYEMDADETMERFMAQRTKISPRRLATGKLKPSEEKRAEKHFQEYRDDPDFLPIRITSNIKDLASVEAYLDEYHPDVMVVDGAYFMENAEEDTRTQEIESMLRGLLQLGQRYECLIMLTTQALESKMQGHRLKSTSGAHSSAWQQYAHLMLGLERIPIDGSKDTEEDARLLRVLASRMGAMDVEVNLTWDWGSLTFAEA